MGLVGIRRDGRRLSGRLKESEARTERLKEQLHDVKLAYATKKEAEADRKTVTDALNRLENKIDKLADKIDHKADKS